MRLLKNGNWQKLRDPVDDFDKYFLEFDKKKGKSRWLQMLKLGRSLEIRCESEERNLR